MALLIGRLLAALLDPLLEGLERAHQVPGAIQRLLAPRAARIAHRLGGLGQLTLEVADVAADHLLELAGILRRTGPNEATRIPDLLLELALADAVGRFLYRARRVTLVATEFGRRRVEPPLEIGHLRLHPVLPLYQPSDALDPLRVRQVAQPDDLVGDVRLFRGQIGRPPLRILDVTRQAAALLALQLTLHLTQLVERRAGLGEALVVGVGGRPQHRVGHRLQTPCRLHHIGRPKLPRQPLEPSRRLFGLFGQRALRRAAAGLRGLPATGPAPLPLGLLLLPARQLLEPLHQLVDLVVGGLLLSALYYLVLVLELVELELEQVGQILGRALSAAPAAAAAALLDEHFVVRLLGALQLLQRSLFRRQRRIDVLLLQGTLGRCHLGRGTREHRENRPERRVGRHHPAVHPAQQRLDLFTQPALRQCQEHEVVAIVLVAEGVAVADDVEGRRDDLPLRLGQRPGSAATTTAPAATL